MNKECNDIFKTNEAEVNHANKLLAMAHEVNMHRAGVFDEASHEWFQRWYDEYCKTAVGLSDGVWVLKYMLISMPSCVLYWKLEEIIIAIRIGDKASTFENT